MAGIDANTGKTLDGFAHVEQSLEKIFGTRQGERVMREWLGNPGLRLLGENATARTILVWFNTLWMLVELFEPRVKVKRFSVQDISRLGFTENTMHVEHRPYAHLGWQQAALYVSVVDGAVKLRSGL